MALLEQALAVIQIPVLAAGGIGSGRAMAAALAAGAEGIRGRAVPHPPFSAGIHPQHDDRRYRSDAAFRRRVGRWGEKAPASWGDPSRIGK